MIEIDIPDYGRYRLDHLVLDYNGTIAVDGQLLPAVANLLLTLAHQINIVVLTADTFGSVQRMLTGYPCTIAILPPGDQAVAKRDKVRELGPDRCVCVGNGRNDRLMLQEAALGIAVIQQEGAAAATLMAADVVCTAAADALALLQSPRRLTATLRA